MFSWSGTGLDRDFYRLAINSCSLCTSSISHLAGALDRHSSSCHRRARMDRRGVLPRADGWWKARRQALDGEGINRTPGATENRFQQTFYERRAILYQLPVSVLSTDDNYAPIIKFTMPPRPEFRNPAFEKLFPGECLRIVKIVVETNIPKMGRRDRRVWQNRYSPADESPSLHVFIRSTVWLFSCFHKQNIVFQA